MVLNILPVDDLVNVEIELYEFNLCDNHNCMVSLNFLILMLFT